MVVQTNTEVYQGLRTLIKIVSLSKVSWGKIEESKFVERIAKKKYANILHPLERNATVKERLYL
jgi:hypothetical protein